MPGNGISGFLRRFWSPWRLRGARIGGTSLIGPLQSGRERPILFLTLDRGGLNPLGFSQAAWVLVAPRRPFCV